MTTPYDFEHLTSLPIKEKCAELSKNGKPFHVLFAEQFDRDTLELLCSVATKLRKIAKNREGMDFLRSLLSHKSAMMYFTQPSTRTFLSFIRACQYLGMDYAEVRDPRISSAYKGESDIDGVRTFSNYFDIIIMRHPGAGFAERTAYTMNSTKMAIPVISAGAGPDEHPTQALLDAYTLKRSFENRKNGLAGLHIAFMGDVARGRTVRSLAKLLTLYPDVRMTFVAPGELRIKKDLAEWLDRKGVNYTETDDVRQVIRDIDAMYVTRVQDEYDEGKSSLEIDYTPFHMTLELLELMKPESVIMHPLPRRAELDPAIDSDPRARYWDQERNGMWIRAALVAYVFSVESRILDYYGRHYTY